MKFLSSFLFISLLFGSFAKDTAAQQPFRSDHKHNHSVYERIDRAYKDGELTIDQKVLYKFYVHGNRKKIPAKYNFTNDKPVKCGTPAIIDYKRNKKRLTAATVNEVEGLLSNNMQASESYDSPSGNFTIHYETTGEHAVPAQDNNTNGIPDYVEAVAAAADSSYRHEVQTLGYSDPLPALGTYHVEIQNLSAFYGETSTASPYGGETYIRIENDFAEDFPPNDDPDGKQLGAVKVTMAHEFKHAIQYEANRWKGETGYWLEMDATLMEEVVYDVVNDYYNYLDSSDSIFNNPQRNFSPGSYYHISWALFFEEKFGSQFWVDVWDIIKDNPFITMVDAVTQNLGGPEAYKQNFVENHMWHFASGPENSAPGYGFEEGSDYPSPRITSSFFGDDSLANPDTLRRMSARYYFLQPSNFPGKVAVNSEGLSAQKSTVGILGYFKDGTTEYQSFPSHSDTKDQLETGWKWDELKKVGIVVTNSHNAPPTPIYGLAIRSVDPTETKLVQNYPNPFNNQTTIRYSITETRNVTLEVFDMLGRKVMTLVDNQQNPGIYTYPVKADNMASGVYFYRLILDGKAETQKMTLVK